MRGNRAVYFLVVLMPLALMARAGTAQPLGNEAQSVIGRVLASPVIKPEDGFRAKLLIPPGELYDPLFMVPHGKAVWMNDDGKATDGHGSRLLSVSMEGKISVLMGAERLVPVTGFDIAPQSFGTYGGGGFFVAQPTTRVKGGLGHQCIPPIAHSSPTP